MKKQFLFFLVFILAECSIMSLSGFTQDEQLIVTTYYPSPSGSYNELGVDKLAINVSGDSYARHVAVDSEYNAMRPGDAHIGWSMIIGSGGGSGFAYDELCDPASPANCPGDGEILVKRGVKIGFNHTDLPESLLQIERGVSPGGVVGRYGSLRSGVLYIDSFEGDFSSFANNYYWDPSLTPPTQYLASNAPTCSLLIGQTGSSDIDFRTFPRGLASAALPANPSNRLMIKQNGRVGVNTASPAEALDVNGWLNAQNFCINGRCYYIVGTESVYYDSGTAARVVSKFAWGAANYDAAAGPSCSIGRLVIIMSVDDTVTAAEVPPYPGGTLFHVNLFGCIVERQS